MGTRREQDGAAGARGADADEQPPNQGERYEQGERSQQRQYEQGDPGATEGEDPFHQVERDEAAVRGRSS